MAVINEYKMYGVTSVAAEGPIKFFGTTTISGVVTQNPLVSETYIIKSLHVTNKSASNTPTITITQTLTAASSVEILTNPMVVEGNTVLSYTTAGTVSDGVDITISYLNIKKEVTV